MQDYQFWTRTDEEGFFYINGVRPGQYNLYAWIPGFIGDYKYDDIITITPGPLSFLLSINSTNHLFCIIKPNIQYCN